MNPWTLQPEAKHDRSRDCVDGVVSRLQAILARDGEDVTTRLEPDSVEMLALQLKLGAAHLLAAAQTLREVEHERRALAQMAERHAARVEREWEFADFEQRDESN
jgi:hypothetical protein